MKSTLPYLKHYLLGAGASAFNGGNITLKATLGVSLAKIAGAPIDLPNLHVLWLTWAGAAFLTALNYFVANPLPVLVPQATTTIQQPPTP